MSLKLWKIIASVGLVIASMASSAHHLVFSDNTVRAAIPGMKNTAGFFTLNNKSNQDEVLVAASSSIAKRVEFHTHEMTNGTMRMSKLDQILLPANSTVKFESGGLHLMFLELKPFSSKTVDVEFTTLSGNKFTITFDVKSILDQHQH